ncbi:MAG TPA: ROK family protein [Candidatus Atribacteria bacterium]|nr:ROK family protein [Candidatus Atribacteria bacterium]
MVKTAFLGIDLGGTNTKVALVNEEGMVLERSIIPTRAVRKAEEVVKDIASEAMKLRKRFEERGFRVQAAGIGIPGLIDWEKGICLLLPNFPNKWKEIPIREWLEEELSLPVAVINDVRAITLAEKRFGAGKEVQSLVMVAIGTGIGGGVVLNGDLYIGKDGAAGEFGHLTVEPNGLRCGCGSWGCLEAYSSGPAMVAQALRALVHQSDTLIRDMVDNDLSRVSPKIVAEAAQKGDAIAVEIIERAGSYIGQALSCICVVVNPEMVVIGGGVAQAGELLFKSIEQSLRERLYIIPVDTIQIVPAQLGMDAGAIGTATWAKERLEKGVIG